MPFGDAGAVAVIRPAPGFMGRRMAAFAFVSQNVATGLTFGSFGTCVLAIQARYETSRTLASFGLSLVILALCITVPFVGAKLEAWTIRRTMVAGILLGAIGYAALAVAPSIGWALAAYGLLIGPSLAMFGVVVSNTLVTNWYVEGRGRALGFVNMPVAVMVVPLVSLAILERHGLPTLFICIALAHLPLLPVAMMVVDRPEDVGQRPFGAGPATPEATAPENAHEGAILRGRELWLLTVAMGLLVGAGAMKSAHMVPLIVDQGRSMEDAALLLSISGGTGILGSLLMGWMADRIGGALALALNALVQSVVWIILAYPVGMALLVVDAVIIGICGGGATSAQGVLLGRIYGTAGFSRSFGLLGMTTMPFVFGFTPLAGLLYDATGNYRITIFSVMTGMLIAAVCFLVLRRSERYGMHQSGANA